MSLEKLIKNYAAYNYWATAIEVNYIRTKPEKFWSQEVVSSFSSIIGTLHHILVSQEYWLSILSETKNSNERSDNDEFKNEEVLNSLIENSAKFNEWVNQLSETDLHKEVRTHWNKKYLPVYDVLQHCFNHGSYHRGQLTTLFRQLGFKDIPNFDYYEYLKLKEGNSEPLT